MFETRRRAEELPLALLDFYSEGLSAATYVDRVFALTSRLLRFSLNSHGVIDKKTGVLTANFDCDLPGLADAFAAFGRHMKKYKAFRFDPTVNKGQPFSARDFYCERSFADLDIYQEVYRPMRFVDHCFANVKTDDDSVVFVGFLRDGRAFDAAEKQLVAQLQPHLSHGRKLALAMSAAGEISLTPELFEAAGFTPRECDVLFWLTSGKSNDEIAKILHLRADSVSRYVQGICTKLGVDHRLAAVLRALELGRTLHTQSLAKRGGKVSTSVSTSAASTR